MFTNLYNRLEDDFSSSTGNLESYKSGTALSTMVPENSHYDIRAFHNDNPSLPWTMIDLKFWNAFFLSTLTPDDITLGRFVTGRTFRRKFMTEIDPLTMDDLDHDTMSDLDFKIISAGNEEWPVDDPDIVVGKDSTYRYSDVISVNLTGAALKTIVSRYNDDILTGFDDPSVNYLIELILRNFPAQAAGAHLDLANSFIDFTSDTNFDPTFTDSVRFNESINNLSAGGDVVFQINRNRLVNADIENLIGIRFRLLSVGNFTFKAQSMRLIPNGVFTERVIDIDTKRGYLSRVPPRAAGAESNTPYGSIYFSTSRPKNLTYFLKFNSGHNPVGNDNAIKLYLRYDPVTGDNISAQLFARSTQSRLRIYQTHNGVTTEIFSTPINTNTLTAETDYFLVANLQEDTINVSIYLTDGIALGALVYETTQKIITTIGRGYVGYSFEPYNYDFTINFVAPNNVQFANFESTIISSVSPVGGGTLQTQTSLPVNLIEGSDLFAYSDATVNREDFVGHSNVYHVIRTGGGWVGGIRSTGAFNTGSSRSVRITGDIYPLTQLHGLYRVALLDENNSVAFIGYLTPNILPNQWNHFDIPVTSDLLPIGYQIFIHQAGFFADQFFVDNLKVEHLSIGWELSPDAGTTWQPLLFSKDGTYTGTRFISPGPNVKIKASGLSELAWVSGYELDRRFERIGQSL